MTDDAPQSTERNFRYPIFLDVGGKRCLVTGEGYEISAKVKSLVDCGAQVNYVNPTAVASIEQLASTGKLRWEQRAFQPSDLDGCFLVIASLKHNEEVFRLAEQQRILCNSVDDPAHCRFSFGSIHRQSDLTIAMSTNGKAPAVAVRLREQMERTIGPEYGQLIQLLGEIRPRITGSIKDFESRKKLWYQLVDSAALDLLRAGRQEEAASLLSSIVAASVPPDFCDVK